MPRGVLANVLEGHAWTVQMMRSALELELRVPLYPRRDQDKAPPLASRAVYCVGADDDGQLERFPDARRGGNSDGLKAKLPR